MASLDKWGDYTRAKEAMFLHCDTSDAPWTVIKSDCKKRARLNAMRYLLHRLPYANKDLAAVGAVDPLVVGPPALVSVQSDDQAYAGGRPGSAKTVRASPIGVQPERCEQDLFASDPGVWMR
jgi:hypothetical protein